MDPIAQQPPELTLDESIATIVPQLPQPIQDFFSSGKVEEATKKIVDKYKLHVDQGAVVEREIIMLLLGINNADAVTKALTEDASMTGSMLDGVIDDLNALVFSPIRNALRAISVAPTKEDAPQPAAPKAAMPVVPRMPVPLPPQPAVQVPAPRPLPPPANLPEAPKPMQLLEDHEEPSISIPKISKPQPVVAAAPVVKAPLMPPVAPKPAMPAPPIVKEYSSDPYREPVDPK